MKVIKRGDKYIRQVEQEVNKDALLRDKAILKQEKARINEQLAEINEILSNIK